MKTPSLQIFKTLGPGLLFAGAAIGVSHLVQSTRAGSDFGFGLIWALLIVNVFKYPFFQYGPRYATATGESLIEGYNRLGKGVLILYFILTFLTMFTIQAAVTVVTAGLAANLFGISVSLTTWSIIITLICLAFLIIGKYKVLDTLMKIIILTLSVSSIIAVAIAFYKSNTSYDFTQIIPKGSVEIGFLIAFLGWMPAPLDVSTWQSLWTLEKRKDKTQQFDSKQALFDFNVGYVVTIFLGLCFMALGTLVLFHSQEEISNEAIPFAKQLIHLYTVNLGAGASIFIAIAAFTTMFSTTLTTLDASPRAMAKSSELLFQSKTDKFYLLWILLLAVGTIIILTYFTNSMLRLIKIATILSFLTAPFYAIANFILISGRHTPKEFRPSLGLKILSYCGILFLFGFSVWYLANI